jgi:PAS domain S-box-containing protein
MRRVEAEKERFRSIFTNVGDVVFQIDREHRYLAMNAQVERYGTTVKQMVGRTVYDVMPKEHADRIARIHAQAFAENAPVEFETQHGATKFAVTLSPIRNAEGHVTSLVGVSRDITKERAVQDALRQARDAADAASQAKTFFLANVSHELRTPLAVIAGFAEMLDGEGLDAEAAKRAVTVIRQNSGHLSALVSDILDLSLIETGRLRIERQRVALEAALEAALAQLRAAARGKGLSFATSLAPDLPAQAGIDPVRLRQILTNVVGNAVKFTDRGGIEVHAGMQGATLAIAVRDTGCGIDPQSAATLFQPFTQADASTSRRFGGTGLGLALARSLARAMGGDVALAHSAPEQGSSFQITLQLTDIEPGAAAVAAKPAAEATDLSGARILIVDDTPDIRAMLEESFGFHGAQVDAVGDGRLGLALAGERAYDVILMDIQLPEIDGYEVTRRLRAAGTRAAVIALTGRASRGEHAACLAAGCDDYMAKPFSLATLLARTSDWVRQKRLEPPSKSC